MSFPPRCHILIFDLGDVLLTWSPVTNTSISPKILKAILSSTIWHGYERGRLSEDECYRLSGDRFSLDPQELRRAILDARDSLRPDQSFISFIRDLQSEAQNSLRIFAMSNISAPDYAVARAKPEEWGIEWGIFERIFTSAAVGMRKPELCFFKFVLDQIKAEPSSVVFVDDRSENVLAARSLGMNGIVFDDVQRVRQSLRMFTGDPVSRGLSFLDARAGQLESETNDGQIVAENFAQLLILEATNKRELVNYVDHPRTWNFFRERPVLTTDEFPSDLDTTSVGLIVTQPDDHVFDSVMDEMLQYTTTDRIPMTYFDAERTRTDPIVALNVLRLFYSRGRGHELSPTLDWVLGVLEHRAYLDGTRYYETAECFLFFAAQLLRAAPDPYLHARLAPLLRARIEERTGAASDDALALAMRVLAGSVVGLRLAHDLALLLPLQCEDGGWGPSWIYKYGSSGVKIGNRGLTTALALNAISALQSPPQPQPPEPLWTLEKSGLLPVGLPLSPPPPLLPVKDRKGWTFSVGTVVKAVYAYVFAATGTSTRRQDPGVDVRRHKRGGSVGA
ncbi:HAD-like domain-containing protein [Lactarius deliciosus]|nr:HAD-like domain-containing protein [Lactarius deliciosus]